tara:strand:+ start:185 stop:385 length:201 start_codon:yes stop_codon:yes gene_type:complete
VKVQLFFSFSLKKKKINRKIFVSFFFIFVSTRTQTPTRKNLNADVLSHVREFTVHREEEEDRGGGV